MKLQFPFNVQNAKTFEDLIKYAAANFLKIQGVINANLDLTSNFSTPKIDPINNMSWQLITCTFSGAGTFGFAHSLGNIPRGFINCGSSSTTFTLASGKQPNTTSSIYLNANGAGTAKVLVF